MNQSEIIMAKTSFCKCVLNNIDDNYKDLLESMRSIELRSQNMNVVVGILTAGLFAISNSNSLSKSPIVTILLIVATVSLSLSISAIIIVQIRKTLPPRNFDLPYKEIESLLMQEDICEIEHQYLEERIERQIDSLDRWRISVCYISYWLLAIQLFVLVTFMCCIGLIITRVS